MSDILDKLVDPSIYLRVKVAGVTFPCLKTGENRQTILARLYDEDRPQPVIVEHDVGNTFDEYAMVVKLVETGEDIGFIPRSERFFLVQVDGEREILQAYSRSNLNALMEKRTYSGEVYSIFPPQASGANYGITIDIQPLRFRRCPK